MNTTSNWYGYGALLLLLMVIIGIGLFSTRSPGNPSTPSPQPAHDVGDSGTQASSTMSYHNETYRFTFSLPADWKGYTSVNSSWTGYVSCSTGQCPSKTGPEILIRNPNWTSAHLWQDIPIMIFTHDEWNQVISGSLTVSAAPILPTELGENGTYVFALPPRYNYAYLDGWQAVEMILQNHPLQTF